MWPAPYRAEVKLGSTKNRPGSAIFRASFFAQRIAGFLRFPKVGWRSSQDAPHRKSPPKRLKRPQRLKVTGYTPNASCEISFGKNRNYRDSPKRLFYCKHQYVLVGQRASCDRNGNFGKPNFFILAKLTVSLRGRCDRRELCNGKNWRRGSNPEMEKCNQLSCKDLDENEKLPLAFWECARDNGCPVLSSIDADLEELVGAWPLLSAQTQEAILHFARDNKGACD